MAQKILIIFGTRPEAIKMVPVEETHIHSGVFDVTICVTAQHRQMLDQVLDLFDNTSYDMHGKSNVLRNWRSDIVLVHGDTTIVATLAAYYEKIPEGHVEAGCGQRISPLPCRKR